MSNRFKWAFKTFITGSPFANIKQDDMAYACKISQANFSAIEKNRREVGPRIALKLAAFMGLSPDVVLYPNGYEAEPEYKEVRERFASLVPVAAKGRS
ncbi:MAG: helix-turn-helix transcriptional regulator [Bdellovibrionaceae bacterium]|nr:helix-turn-helix transcriptional regulator [Bdellovibrio sp.]